MRRHHHMPFGSALIGNVAHFRLWAPAATRVEVQVTHERGRAAMMMAAQGDGWYDARLGDLGAGASYHFRIDDRINVPDPASRYNPHDIHAASVLTDPAAFEWSDDAWQGLPWAQAVVYELHVGTFTPEGTFAAAAERLDYLADLGVTAIELMPLADFPGKRNWGYDGVLLFAPDASYGTPEDLKHLIDAAHRRGLMVLLDVVYNHFGPEGNYLHEYAPQFFDADKQTPWGATLNFGGAQSRTVRDFFIQNALYWLTEFNLDGLRLDAVHAIIDDSDPDIISELAAAVRNGPGRERARHLILENDRNCARYLRRGADGTPAVASAQWCDDVHHCLHVMLTHESEGYYIDYVDEPLALLGRALAEGFAYQGQASRLRHGEARGEPSADLPPAAFVIATQTHDQIGNRAFGERIAMLAPAHKLRLAVACTLLAPEVPMLFMGEEFAASSPFLFFCDFGEALNDAVRKGRRAEFAAFSAFSDPAILDKIPDAPDEATFMLSKLRWEECTAGEHAAWHTLYRELLRRRREKIAPHLTGNRYSGRYATEAAESGGGLRVDWTLPDGSRLHLRANFSDQPWTLPTAPPGELVYASEATSAQQVTPWGGLWTWESTA